MQLLIDIEENSASEKMSVVQVSASITEVLPNVAPTLESEKEVCQSLRATENVLKNTTEEDNDKAKIEDKGDIGNGPKDDAAKVDENNEAKANQVVAADEEVRADYIAKIDETLITNEKDEKEEEDKSDAAKIDESNDVEMDQDAKVDKEATADVAKVDNTRKTDDKAKIGDEGKFDEENKLDAAKADENNYVEMDQDAKVDKEATADVTKVDNTRKTDDKAKIGDGGKFDEENKLDAAKADENNEVGTHQDAKACKEVTADDAKVDETRTPDDKAKIEEEGKLDAEKKSDAVKVNESNEVNMDQDARENKKVKEDDIAKMDETPKTDDKAELEEGERNFNEENKLDGENNLQEENHLDEENKLVKETPVEEETLMGVEANLEDETKKETEANMDKETELDGEQNMEEDVNMIEELNSETSQGISKNSDKTENSEINVAQEKITNDDTKDQEDNLSNIDDSIDEDELLKETLNFPEINNTNNAGEIDEITTTNDSEKNTKDSNELGKCVELMDEDILNDSLELEKDSQSEAVNPAKSKEVIVNGDMTVEAAKLDVETSKQVKECDDSSKGSETEKQCDKSGHADTDDLKNEPDLDDFINSTDVQKDPTLDNLELDDINENATTSNVTDIEHEPKTSAKTAISKPVAEETTDKEKSVKNSEENTVVLTGNSTTDVSPKETDKVDNDKVQNSEPPNKPTNATQDISSDDEIENSSSAVPNAVNNKMTDDSSDKPVQNKECVSLVDDDDDNDDIMLIDEDTNTKTDKTSDETPKETGALKAAESFKESSSDDDVVISSDVCEKVTPVKELSTKEAEKTTTEDTIDESKTKIRKIEDGPLVAINFLNSFKTKMGDMTRADLEEFCILKIVEGVVDRSNLSEIKGKLKTMMQNVEEWRKKVMVLNKQNRDLQIVLRTVQEEQKKRSDEVITPLKITRSVGMQVLMTENKVDGAHRTRGQKRSFPNNVIPPPPKNNPVKIASMPTKNLKTPIPVPRLVPALNSSPAKGCNVRISPQVQNSTVTSNSGAGKAATPNGVKAYTAKPAEKRSYSVSIDLTDDEPPPAKQMATGKGLQPPVRLVPSQQLMAPGHRASLLNHSNAKNSNPRQVYIPIGGQQGNIRPGQTVVFKNTPNVRARQPNPGTVVRPVRAPVARNQNKHPAPLPQVFSQQPQPPNWKALPPAPDLKISKIENGIVVSWKIDGYQEDSFEEIVSYQLFAYQETSAPASTFLWNKIGDIKALPLPMACTLTQFIAGYKYYFAVRAVDIKSRIGPFSLPGSILLLNK